MMADIPRIAFLLIVGFCIGTVTIGLSAQSLFRPDSVTSTDFAVSTQTTTLTSTLTHVSSSVATSTLVSTATSVTTSTSVSTSVSLSTVTSDATSYITDTTTTSLTGTGTGTSTVTSVSTSTVTSTVTSLVNDSSTDGGTNWIADVTGSQTNSGSFVSPSTSVIITGEVAGNSSTQSDSILWVVSLTSSGNTVAQGSVPASSTFSLSLSGLQSRQGYTIEVVGNGLDYQVEVYPPS